MSRRGAALSALSATVAVAFGSLFYAFSVLVTEKAAGSEFSTSLLSTAYGGTVLVGGGLAFLIGRVVDARGVRLIMGTGSVLGASGLAALGLADSGWQIIAASWLLIGPAGAMTFYEPAFVALDQWYEPDERGQAIGILTVVGGLAGPIFLPVTAFMVERLGWRPAAMLLGATLAMVGISSALLVLPSGSRGGHRPPQAGTSLGALLSNRRFVLYTISVLLLFGSFQTVLFHRIALFEGAGFRIGVVSFWAGVSGWLSFPGRYVGPILGSGSAATRWNAVGAAVLSLSLVPMLVADSGGMMVLHFLVFGVVFGALLPMRAAVMGTWFSGPSYGRIMGIQWTMAAVAGAAGPSLAGVWRDTAGSYGPAIVAVIVALLVSALLVVLAGREP